MRIIIIAGPNGAGKTTFATEFLLQEADCPTFINVDLIARSTGTPWTLTSSTITTDGQQS